MNSREKRVSSEEKLEKEQKRYEEREKRIALQRKMEAKLAAEEQRKQIALLKKKQELEKTVGAPVSIRHVDRWGCMADEDLNKLTPAMITQMKTVTDKFAKRYPVNEIVYIMNDHLYEQFDETRSKFRQLGRGTQEIIGFHGTDRKNINSYRLRIYSSLI